jgi:phosphate transport system substrate-binding protein
MKKALRLALAAWLTAPVLSVAACAQALVLVGSGSTVPAPLFDTWSDSYNRRSTTAHMRYLAAGTGEGLNNISHGAGDFAAGEIQLSAKDKATLLALPSVVIGIAPIYNLPGISHELRFSGEVLAEIYMGTVKMWNAPQIAKLNPGVALPDVPIRVVYRPGAKGSNYIFTEFLSKTSPRFKATIGVTASPKWPVGTPAERSSDMADKVKSQTGAIGYVEVQYAIRSDLSMGQVQNAAGHFVKASPETLRNACHSVEAPGWDNFSASLTNAPGADSFPITSFTWIYVRTSGGDPQRAAALNDLLNWVYSQGQQIAAGEGYTELPPALLEKVRAKVASLR